MSTGWTPPSSRTTVIDSSVFAWKRMSDVTRTGSRTEARVSRLIGPLVLAVLTIAGVSNGSEQDVNTGDAGFTGDYLGRTPPGLEAEVFDSGELIGEARVFNMAFSPAGDELFFSVNRTAPGRIGPDYEIMHMRRVGDRWTAPETAWFSGEYSDCDLTFSPSADLIFFASELRPHPVTGEQMDIYYLEWTEDGWSDPIHAGTEVNTEHGEVHASMSAHGNLFYRSSRPDGYGDDDIWQAEWVDGEFVNARNLGPAINTEHMETDCFIAPDESYLLYNTIRPEHGSRPQVYVSFKRDDGTWTTGRSLGPAVNCEAGSMGSVVTPDGRALFYTSRCSGDRAVQWISTEVIHRLRE